MNHRILLIVALIASWLNVVHAGNEEAQSFLGRWEYRQPNSGSETGYDPEGEIIEFTISDGKIEGIYFGLERMGEHGLFYSVVKVKDLIVDNGQISFLVPGRYLFAERPETLEAAQEKRDAWAGITKVSLKMTGILEEGKLALMCSSEPGECPDTTLIFKKGKWVDGD